MKIKSYRHFPIEQAEDIFEESCKSELEVHTINWTCATKNKKQNCDNVHYNIYHTTLSKLIDWVRDTEEVAEDIIKIKELII
jgi:hypothetical protein